MKWDFFRVSGDEVLAKVVDGGFRAVLVMGDGVGGFTIGVDASRTKKAYVEGWFVVHRQPLDQGRFLMG